MDDNRSPNSPLSDESHYYYGAIDSFEAQVKIVSLSEEPLKPHRSSNTVATLESEALTRSTSSQSGSSSKKHRSDFLFKILGFQENPFRSTPNARNSSASDMRLAVLSNFSTAYNIVSISLALRILETIYPHGATAEAKSMCASALIAGMIFGQLMGGTIGDVLGRHLAMAVVMALQVVGALLSAFSVDFGSGGDIIFVVIAACRFVLGLGCGGVYPLAATLTAETSKSKEDGSKAVALTFSMQGFGYLSAPLFGCILLQFLPLQPNLVWRLLLGFGAVPGVALMIMRLQRQKAPSGEADAKNQETKMREVPVSIVDAIKMEENLLVKMLGTGGCWFLFDVLFYGNTLFQPIVLDKAFGKSESIESAALYTCLISLIALPGYLVSVATVGQQSPRLIQAQGFMLMAILYALIGVFFHDLAESKFLLIATYGSTFFFSNYGPNATTYLLPSMTYSRHCRSTLNGLCAACGKVGALLGTMIFAPVAGRFGQQFVMISCAIVSVLGLILTLTCVQETVGRNHTREEARQHEKRLSRLPTKFIFSAPSLLDYYSSENDEEDSNGLP